ncbi:hypothetical protein DXV75_13175 [Alteromonas aestuariivivens]|uniref:Uncharacterized protein n=1 Tax=Alteromonas aestuariivivens TaxID=1938339 RepID=A0A3D8M4P8_9ALTE|nr:hypothetical protein DXV75_13175 [Alteromonas aestuariivivens]
MTVNHSTDKTANRWIEPFQIRHQIQTVSAIQVKAQAIGVEMPYCVLPMAFSSVFFAVGLIA